ncbi:MAG: hypothetical protein ABI877_22260 [Gemmatimonadaceae bacterium]
MSSSILRKGGVVLATVALVVVATKALAVMRQYSDGEPLSSTPQASGVVEEVSPSGSATRGIPEARVEIRDTLLGQSGALRFATLTSEEALRLPGFLKAFGEEAIRTPAVRMVVGPEGIPFALVVVRPFGAKRGEWLGSYRLGRWPAEQFMMARNYYNPDGFVEVTQENVGLPLSEHFVLGDFLTHDQDAVWPKYVVLEEKLIDKLELVMQELARRGYAAQHAVILSGFRAPYYNDRGVGEGMARASRHQYGDAADLLIDENGDGRMDDLNRDGRVDLADVAPISAAVAQVERSHPELLGGLGTYTAMGPRGPFAHIDVRGTSARWESGWWKQPKK